MKKQMLKALKQHAEGHIAKHVTNVEVYMANAVGVGEHSDLLETVEKELAIIAEYHDQLEVLEKYFENDSVH